MRIRRGGRLRAWRFRIRAARYGGQVGAQVIVGGIVCVLLGAFVAHVVSAQDRAASRAGQQGRLAEAREASEGGDWPTYNRDLAGTRYSPLTQINATNVSTLKQAWSYRLRPEPGRSVPAVDKPASSFEIF